MLAQGQRPPVARLITTVEGHSLSAMLFTRRHKEVAAEKLQPDNPCRVMGQVFLQQEHIFSNQTMGRRRRFLDCAIDRPLDAAPLRPVLFQQPAMHAPRTRVALVLFELMSAGIDVERARKVLSLGSTERKYGAPLRTRAPKLERSISGASGTARVCPRTTRLSCY